MKKDLPFDSKLWQNREILKALNLYFVQFQLYF